MLRVITFKIEEELLERVDRLSKVNGSRSDIIRTAIRLLLYLLDSFEIYEIMAILYHRDKSLYFELDKLLEVKKKVK